MRMEVMGTRSKAIGIVITAGAVAIALSACGGQVTGPADHEPPRDHASSDGVDFVLCPDQPPREGSACTDEGNECLYWGPRSCQGAFLCTGGAWATRECPR